MTPDPWSILGIAPNSSPDEAKAAYRRLAKDHHPDRGGDGEQFLKIQQAYEQIVNPSKQSPANHAEEANPFADVFNFNIFFGQRPIFRNANFETQIAITVAESITGCKRTIQIQDQNNSKTLDIHIPVGSQTGDVVKYAGMGSSAMTDQAPGDLFVKIIVNPYEDFHIQGVDLYCERTITIWQAVVGTQIQVKDPLGANIQVQVPAGIQTNSILRVAERGGLNRNTKKRGDILIKIILHTPAVTQEQLEIITKWL